MKIDSTENKTSFYETFSDLIFATMAIFILLMIVFIVQVNIKKDSKELEEQIKQAEIKLDSEKQKLKTEQKHHSNLVKSKKSLQQYNLELVIAVDTTGSMQRELDQLTDTIGLIGKVLPKIANSVKIGVVAYRRDENEQMDINPFHLRAIRDESYDNKKSFNKLYSFVRRLKAKTGSAPVELAMDQSLKMFSKPEEFTGHQTFMLLGDVGPYEDRYRDQGVESKNIQQEKAMVEQLKLWTKGHMHRNVLILFSGEDEIAKTLRLQGASGMQHKKFVRSKHFFEKLARETGQPEGFSVNSTEMIPHLLSALLR